MIQTDSVRTTPVTGPSVWLSADIESDRSWIVELSPADRAEALAALADVNRMGVARDEIGPETFRLHGFARRLDAIIDRIEGGPGFALLRNVPIEGLELADVERLFWGIVSHMGYPEPQDASGKRLHHVRAEQSFADEAEARTAFRSSNIRGYQTNVELQFHGDGSDALFFLCRNAGKSGGHSRIVSAGAAFNAVIARDPGLALVLQREFYFDTRGELGPERPVQAVPIFAEHRGLLNILHKRGYIDLAQAMPGVPRLTAQQVAALDALDAALNDPAHFFEFVMVPGDLQIANNYTVLHARTAFEDHIEPERRRHMLRIWATMRRKRRSLPPSFRTTREFMASQRRREELGDDAR